MGKGEYFKRFFAGLFVLAGIIGMIGVIWIIGLDRGLSEPKFEVNVLFRDVAGLIKGAPIRLSGVVVGHVRDISFMDKEVLGRGLQVRLSIYEKYRRQIEKSTRFAIKTEGILGEKFIDIKVNTKKKPLDLSRAVIGVDPLDVEDTAEIFVVTAQSLSETSKEVNYAMREVRDISLKTKRLLDRIEQKIIDGNLFKIF